MSRIKVLVVDDSALMRRVLTDILSEAEDILVVGTAESGEVAVEKVLELSPDVVILDILMPGMGGLAALNEIMRRKPTPVIVFSSYDKPDVTLESLEMGAVDFVFKQMGDLERVASELIEKVRVAASVDVRRLIEKKAPDKKFKIVVIGASTGGPRALNELLSRLPNDLPAAILVVQHMPANFTTSLAKRLNRACALEVKEAEDGEVIIPGRVYIAPGGYHLLIEKGSINGSEVFSIKLAKGPKRNNVIPSIDVTMESVAKTAGSRAIGVILTGMGCDGAAGLKAIREAGGFTIAEDPSTCIVYGMPKAAADMGAVNKIMPLHNISRELSRRVT
jgi:two-component system chemotaxis response regulator CheB